MPDTQPQRLPLMVLQSNRGETATKDARLVNGYVETQENKELWIYKRPGISQHLNIAGSTPGGIYNWKGDLYSVVGSTLYKEAVAISGTLNTTGGPYTFSSTLGATQKLFLSNTQKGYLYDTVNGLVEITDVDFPSTDLVPGSVYLDGTTYVMDVRANVYGSDINNPLNWNPLNKLVAQIEPDGGVRLAKQLVYVIAFKQWSTEVFYDAGNPTGSPLGTVQGAKVNVGCRSAASVQDVEGTLLWIAQARDGSASVWLMDSLKAVQVSTPAIDRLLQQADYSTVYSWAFRIVGHKFYGVTLVGSNLTIVYDLTSGVWYQWTDPNGNYLPLNSSTFSSAQQPLVQSSTTGKIYKFALTNTNDEGVVFPMDLYTPNVDFGTRLKKYLKNLDIIADQAAGSSLFIRVSDDDYQTWSNFRQVDLGQARPRLTDCGTFRRRAHHLRHFANTPLRIQALEAWVDLGSL
jgi:hypothetical protein